MEEKNTSLNGKFIIALARTLRATHQTSEALFRKHNLTMAQFAALEALYHKGDMPVGALVEAVLSTSGNMTVVIRNLEHSGLVHRQPNPADGRSFLVCLTHQGQALIAQLFHQHMSLVQQRLAGLTPGEKEAVITILKKLQ